MKWALIAAFVVASVGSGGAQTSGPSGNEEHRLTLPGGTIAWLRPAGVPVKFESASKESGVEGYQVIRLSQALGTALPGASVTGTITRLSMDHKGPLRAEGDLTITSDGVTVTAREITITDSRAPDIHRRR